MIACALSHGNANVAVIAKAETIAELRFWVGIHGLIANRGRVLVLRRSSAVSYRPGAWDLPGGHLAAGESAEQCLLREVKEETGLGIAVDRMLAVLSDKARPYLQILYACRPLIYRPIQLQPNEHVAAKWATAEEISRLELIPYLAETVRLGFLRELNL